MSCNYEVVKWSDDCEALVSRFRELIERGASFKVIGVPLARQSTAVELAELAVTNSGKSSRIRTENRGWTAVAAYLAIQLLSVLFPIFTLVAIATILISLFVFLIHNLVTIFASYEIVKAMIGDDISVRYLK